MKKISFDVMGSDNGVISCVQGAMQFLLVNKDYFIYLVGKKVEIMKYVNIELKNQFEIINSSPMKKNFEISKEMLKEKNSMTAAIELVKKNSADVVLSSGDSGAYLSLTTLMLRRLKGIKRPAFMPIFPTTKDGKRFIMMDVGANIVTTSDMLYDWALLGNTFSKIILDIEKPKIGVVNIGTEENKGHEMHKEVNKKLKENKKLNYIGFIEPKELLNGIVDVAIIDGYAGNMVLKTMEGTIISLIKLLKKNLFSKTIYKIGAFLSRGAFKKLKKTLDYRNVGAAWIIGLNDLALKAHGSSDKQSYIGALNQIKVALDNDAFTRMKKEINE